MQPCLRLLLKVGCGTFDGDVAACRFMFAPHPRTIPIVLKSFSGAIDGKHVEIQAPKLSGSTFFNYKRSFSTILMAVCDEDYCFTFIDVGSYGKEHDASVFAQSEFVKRLADGSLNLPVPSGDLPFVFVGDEAFPLRPDIMRPFQPGRDQTDLQLPSLPGETRS